MILAYLIVCIVVVPERMAPARTKWPPADIRRTYLTLPKMLEVSMTSKSYLRGLYVVL